MDYYIATVVPGKFQINKYHMKLLKAKQLGDFQTGLIIAPAFEYKRDTKTLTIYTKTKMDAFGKQVHNLAEFTCATMFAFTDNTILYSGVNDISIPYVEFILNIAQAHSYGIFCAKCIENDMPLGGMEVTPSQKYRDLVTELLEKNKSAQL